MRPSHLVRAAAATHHTRNVSALALQCTARATPTTKVAKKPVGLSNISVKLELRILPPQPAWNVIEIANEQAPSMPQKPLLRRNNLLLKGSELSSL
eukprot:76719-Prymnesium_polylepis.2